MNNLLQCCHSSNRRNDLIRLVKNLKILTNIGIELSVEQNIDKLLQIITNTSRKLTNAEASAVLLIKKNDDTVQYEFAGISGDTIKKINTMPQGNGIFKIINEIKKPVYISDISKDPRSFKKLPKGHIKVTSFLGAPLINYKNSIYGMIILTHNKPNKFNNYDKELLAIFASQASVALENAKLKNELNNSFKNLEKAHEKLKTLDKLKSDFLSNVTHELFTPLTSIKGYAQILINKRIGELNNQQEEKLNIVLRNTERLIKLINNLLNLIQLENKAPKIYISEFDPIFLTNNCLNEVLPLANKNNIKIIFENKLNKSDKVFGDEEKIHLVLINILGNAIKFTNNGNIYIKIEKISGKNIKFSNSPNKDKCIIKKNNYYIKISIKDTGIGIPQNDIDKIFDKFYQVDSGSTRKFGGTGLGLAIAKDVLNLHNMPIEVTSKSGKGSVFSFVLPKTL